MKIIQSKKHKLGTQMTYVLDDGIRTLAYFHEDSVTSCKGIKKDCHKKDCDN